MEISFGKLNSKSIIKQTLSQLRSNILVPREVLEPSSRPFQGRATPSQLSRHKWCRTSDSNRENTDFESAMSANCISTAKIRLFHRSSPAYGSRCGRTDGAFGGTRTHKIQDFKSRSCADSHETRRRNGLAGGIRTRDDHGRNVTTIPLAARYGSPGWTRTNIRGLEGHYRSGRRGRIGAGDGNRTHIINVGNVVNNHCPTPAN